LGCTVVSTITRDRSDGLDRLSLGGDGHAFLEQRLQALLADDGMSSSCTMVRTLSPSTTREQILRASSGEYVVGLTKAAIAKV
jgi:hypothetical protein